MISHLGAMLPVADGLALAAQLRADDAVAVAICGDGATSEGDVHEAMNLAAVWRLPVVFVIENTSGRCRRRRRSSTPAKPSPTAPPATACPARWSTQRRARRAERRLGRG